MGKSVLVVLGGVLVTAALVDLVVDGWSVRGGLVLVMGLLLGVPPIALAFREAVRAARRV